MSGSTTCSIRGRVSGRLPRLRLAGEYLRRAASSEDVRLSCCSSTSATARTSRSSKASCRSSSLSFSDFLPCTTWFSSATRCSRRLTISFRLIVSPLSARCRATTRRRRRAGPRGWPTGRYQAEPTCPEYTPNRMEMRAYSAARFILPQPVCAPPAPAPGASPARRTGPRTAPGSASSRRPGWPAR